MADVAAALRTWSTTASSNAPSGTTTIGAGLDDNLRQIQATVRQFIASVGANIASATTTDLTTATGSYVNITGTTTITGLGSEVAGVEYWLNFNGILTLTYNATSLILPGAQSIVTAAGDLAKMISLGSGNWICGIFLRADGTAIASPQATVSSATTTNLQTGGADYIAISGTTTITGITLTNGHRRYVTFTGILTLTNGASLVLPGAANITTAAGDTAIFAGEAAGLVRCIVYSANGSVAYTGTGSIMRAASPTTTGTLTAAAITASGAIAPNGGLTPSFESSEQTVTPNALTTTAHGLGRTPKLFKAILRCKTGELGYSTGDEVEVVSTINSTRGQSIFANGTNLGIACVNSTPSVIRQDNFVDTTITVANWRWVLRAW